MTLTKKKMMREIGRRTRLTNREVQEVVETLVDVWTQALVDGEKIEIQNFLILEVQKIRRASNQIVLNGNSIPLQYNRVTVRASKALRSKLELLSSDQ